MSRHSSLFNYLRDVSTDSTFSLSILQVLIEERRTAHRDRQNRGKVQCSLKIGDVVKAHVQVQSRADACIVGKLSYRARGPFIINKVLGGSSFEVQRYDEPNSAPRKYKNTELYLLPLALFPSEVLDTIDERYLDYKNTPIVSPLLKPMRIELCNDKWLQSSDTRIPTRSAHLDLPSTLTLTNVKLNKRPSFLKKMKGNISKIKILHLIVNHDLQLFYYINC